MRRYLGVAAAILRKDILLFWPLAALNAALALLTFYAGASDALAALAAQLGLAAGLVTALLVASVILSDPPASDRHDWLTRPIPSGALLTAKAAFLLLAIVIPVTLGGFVSGLAAGQPPMEALARATAPDWAALSLLLLVGATAALSVSLLQAAAVSLGALVAIGVGIAFTARLSDAGAELFGSGLLWLVFTTIAAGAAAAGTVALGLVYRQRRAFAARAVGVGAALALIAAPAAASWSLLFGTQRALSPDPAAAADIALALEDRCLPVIAIDTPEGEPFETPFGPLVAFAPFDPLAPALWRADLRARVGPGAAAFATPAVVSGAPDGWLLFASRARAALESGDGETLLSLTPHRGAFAWISGRDDGTPLPHAWLLTRDQIGRVADRDAQVRVDYWLSLLRPRDEAELPADGQMRRLPGFGFCRAQDDGGAAQVTCYKRGARPALITAEFAGADSARPVAMGLPDFKPGLLELPGGQEYAARLPRPAAGGPLRVRLIAYEDRAHFQRSLTAPLPFGPSARACAQPAQRNQDAL